LQRSRRSAPNTASSSSRPPHEHYIEAGWSLNLTTWTIKCWQRGHSNVRRSQPGSSGSMDVSHMSVSHTSQLGRGVVLK
jgi:hypothetical protein